MNIGEQSSTRVLTCQDLVSKGKIKWTAFEPPLTGGGGNQNLAGVLATGNDANAQDLLNVGKITMTGGGDASLQTVKSITGVSNLACQNMVTTFATALESNVGDELTMGSSGGSGGIIQFDPNGAPGSHAINGASVTNRCVITNCDLTSSTNTFPTSLDDDNLGDVMSRDNTASTDLNMNGQLITNCQTIGTSEVATPLIQFSSTVGTLLNGSNSPGNPTVCNNLDFVSGSGNIFPSSVAGDLEATLQLGNDANNQDIQGVGTLTATSVSSTAIQNTGICSTGSLLASGVVAQCNTIAESPASVDISVGVTGGQAELDFSGRPGSVGQDTFIRGDTGTDSLGAVKNTKCFNLDLRDLSNRFVSSTNEQYEYGAIWINPQTKLSNNTLADQVFITSYEDDQPGWRYMRPMSDGEDQLTPTAGTSKGEYMPYSASDNPLLAFYCLTAPTTVPSHNNQIITFTFPITRYGYGRIYCGLFYVPDHTPSATPVFIDQSFRMLTENISQPGLADLRKGGMVTMTWVLTNIPNYPTDGTTRWRLYPVIRTDDSEEYGALEIRLGNGVPYDGQLTGSKQGQMSMYGRPTPVGYTTYRINY